MKILCLILLLFFSLNSIADEQTNLSIEEYVKEYRGQILKMSMSLDKDEDVPTYVNGIKIKMSVAVKKTASGSIEFWVVQAGADIEKLSIQEHELNLSFGEDGRQRVAELNNESDDHSGQLAAAKWGMMAADFDVDVLLPSYAKSMENVRLIAIPANVKTIYATNPTDSTKYEALNLMPDAKHTISWGYNPKLNSDSVAEAKLITIEDSKNFKLLEIPNSRDYIMH